MTLQDVSGCIKGVKMAIRTKTIITPDCPKCGEEMNQCVRYESGTQDEFHPFGKKKYWWECKHCHFRTDEKEDIKESKIDALMSFKNY